jgi:hypothetical protein
MKSYLKFAGMVLVSIMVAKLALRFIPGGDKVLAFL